MDEYTRTLHEAVDAAALGDRQALYMAQWLLADQRRKIEQTQPQATLGTAFQTSSSTAAIPA